MADTMTTEPTIEEMWKYVYADPSTNPEKM